MYLNYYGEGIFGPQAVSFVERLSLYTLCISQCPLTEVLLYSFILCVCCTDV
jgi:hypothetical protein